jgi:hypothetical protein
LYLFLSPSPLQPLGTRGRKNGVKNRDRISIRHFRPQLNLGQCIIMEENSHDVSHREDVFGNADLLRIIISPANITTGRDYKSVIIVCHGWNRAIANQSRADAYQHPLSLLVLRHPKYRWDLKKLSSVINEDVARKYMYTDYGEENEWKTNRIISNKRISSAFLKKYWGKRMLHKRVYMSELFDQFIDDKLTKKEKQYIIENRQMSIEIIEAHCYQFDEDDWYNISSCNILTPDFIRKHIHSLNWHRLTTILTEELVNEFTHLVYWSILGLNPNLSTQFIRTHIARLNVEHLCKQRNFTMDLIVEYYEKLDWQMVSLNVNLTSEFILTNWKKLNKQKLSTNRGLPLDIINQKANELDWYLIAINPVVPLSVLKQNIHQLHNKYYAEVMNF